MWSHILPCIIWYQGVWDSNVPCRYVQIFSSLWLILHWVNINEAYSVCEYFSTCVCYDKSVWYLLVKGSRDERIHSWVVAFNVSFDFSKPIHHFLANGSGVNGWCLSFVIVAYPFLVIETLMFHIRLPTMISWANLIGTFTIALLKSNMAMSSWIYVTGGAQGDWVLNWLIKLRLNRFLLC